MSDFDALEWPTMAHGMGTVTTDKRKLLNVRAAPLTGQVLGQLAYGERVIVWAALPSGWYQVQSEDSGLTGYVLGTCIKLDAELVREIAKSA